MDERNRLLHKGYSQISHRAHTRPTHHPTAHPSAHPIPSQRTHPTSHAANGSTGTGSLMQALTRLFTDSKRRAMSR